MNNKLPLPLPGIIHCVNEGLKGSIILLTTHAVHRRWKLSAASIYGDSVPQLATPPRRGVIYDAPRAACPKAPICVVFAAISPPEHQTRGQNVEAAFFSRLTRPVGITIDQRRAFQLLTMLPAVAAVVQAHVRTVTVRPRCRTD
jgi:hypothetical protein